MPRLSSKRWRIECLLQRNRLAGDAGNPERWAWFYRTFRDEAPDVKLIGPALGHSTPAIDNGVWLGRWLDAGASVDAIAAHPYDRIVRMRWKIGRVLRERGLDLPLWAVETSGRTKTGGVGPAKHVVSLQRYGWDRAIIHVIGGWRADRWPKHGIDHFVLFRRDGNHIMPMSGDADELANLARRMRP